MALVPGTYTITNAHHRTFACLPSSNYEQHAVGITEPDSKSHQVGWPIVLLPVDISYSFAVDFEGSSAGSLLY